MKRSLLFVLASAALLLGAVSCNEKEDDFINVDNTSLTIPADKSTTTFTVKSNSNWEIVNYSGWITEITPRIGEGDKTVTVKFNANELTEGRSTVLTVKTKNASESVTLRQTASGEELDIEYTASAVPSEGGTATFTIKTNAEWTISNSNAWITEINPSKGEGDKKVTVTFAANTSASTRSSIFTVSTIGLSSKTVTVSQAGGERPGSAGAISVTNVSQTSVTMSIGEIYKAATYRWYKDGAEVQNTTSRTYTATASGTYKVAGVNATGVGQASVEKVLTIDEGGEDPLYTADDLVGTYAVTGYSMDSDGAYYADHTATITKIDNKTVKINYFLGFDEAYGKDPGTFYDEITATIDGTNGTLKIAGGQKFPGYLNASYMAEMWPTHITQPSVKDNVGKEFPDFQITGSDNNISFDLAYTDALGVTINDVPMNTFCFLFAISVSDGSNAGWVEYYVNTKFSKTSSNITFPAPAHAPRIGLDRSKLSKPADRKVSNYNVSAVIK